MPEVNIRECYIHLLDGRKLTVQVKPLQLASDLLSIVASHLKLREKENFGLYYDVNGEYQCWLQPGLPVVEQVPGTNIDIIILHFGVTLFYESFKQLHDVVAKSLYYSQCQQLIYKSQFHCTLRTLVKLTAISLQAQLGDFTTEQVATGGLRELKYLPNSLANTETYEECEEEIIAQYRLLVGMQKNEALSMYLEIVQELQSYGMHFYSVKDKNEEQKLIGIGLNGITLFNIDNRNNPEQIYLWAGISKISSRDNKFMIEITSQSLDLDQLQVDENVFDYNVSSYQCHSMTTVRVWLSDSPQMVRAMDEMAVIQLNSFEQRKKIRMGIRLFSSASSTSSISSSVGSITHSSPGCTQKSDNSTTSMEATQVARLASREHYNALKNKKEELERFIEEKEAEMRRIIIEEAKLTGIIPDSLTEEEKATLPKQMATTYTLQYLVDSELFKSIQSDSMSMDPENDKEVKRLSREYEIQCNIVKAHLKIYKGTFTSKKIKKQRKKNYRASEKKLIEIEKALERRRDFLGISCRQSRFYSQVTDKEDYNWEVVASKSFTMPHKQQLNSQLPSVDENRITQQNSTRKIGRHSSALPARLDTSILKTRQAKHNTSATVYNKKSNASDSFSTASPLDGSSFLSLYSRDSSSRLSSSSVTSDDSRCISCPATEEMQRKHITKVMNEYNRQKRVSQHLDVALPEKPIMEKKVETIDNLNLDTPHQIIFKPPTRYPEPKPNSSLPFPSSTQSPRDFYARSLPLDYSADENEEAIRFDVHSANFGKYQFSSDQICKQQYEQKLAYKQHNSIRTNRTPSPKLSLPAKTNYPMPYMRVHSVPYGLHSSNSPSTEKINNPQYVRNVTSYSQTHLSPHQQQPNYPNSYTAVRQEKPAYYSQQHSNGHKQTLPITRIHTTPANITTLEYAKPTHYPRAISPNLRNTNIQTRVPHRTEPRVSPQNPILSNPYPRFQNPANNKYIPPACRIQITPPERPDHFTIGQNRYKSPYSHQEYIQTNRDDKYYNMNISNHPTHIETHSLHDPLGYTTSLPMQHNEQSPGVKCKIDYWEYHSAINAKAKPIHVSKSMDKIPKKEQSEFSPPTNDNRQPLNFATTSHSFRNAYHSESNTSAYQRDYNNGMQPASDEGTPV